MIDSKLLFKTLHAIRGYTLQHVVDLDDEKLLKVPNGLPNNVLWNLGHTMFVQCQVSYGASGQPSPIPAEYEAWFKPGTSPTDWKSGPKASEVIDAAKSLNKTIADDYAAGKFSSFNTVPLAEGYALESIEEALNFHVIHEGMHTGVMLALRRLL